MQCMLDVLFTCHVCTRTNTHTHHSTTEAGEASVADLGPSLCALTRLQCRLQVDPMVRMCVHVCVFVCVCVSQRCIGYES